MGETGYAVILNPYGWRCVVVGGGGVAERRLEGLLQHTDSSVTVTVVSPTVTATIERRVRGEQVSWLDREFEDQDLTGASLVFAATDDRELNARVAERCREQGILVNVVDAPELGSFQVPAVAEAGELQIAVSTGGAAPSLAGELARELQEQYRDFDEYLRLLREFRTEVQQRITDPERRAELLRHAVGPELRVLVREARLDELRDRLERLLVDKGKESTRR